VFVEGVAVVAVSERADRGPASVEVAPAEVPEKFVPVTDPPATIVVPAFTLVPAVTEPDVEDTLPNAVIAPEAVIEPIELIEPTSVVPPTGRRIEATDCDASKIVDTLIFYMS
jgi:hypothetical protein